MKLKKLLLVLVAIILIIPAAVIFTACGNDDNHVYLNNVVIRYADGTEKGADSNYINLGSFEYGSSNKPNLDFIVVAKFSDNSETTILSDEIRKDVNNVTVKFEFNGEEIEELPIFEQSSVGYYEITITYQEKTINISYSIEKSDNITYTPILSRYKWEYGTFNPVPTINNYTGTEELNYYYLPYSEKDNAGKGVLASSYTKEANIAPGRYVLWTEVPATDKYGAKLSKIVEFEVTKGMLRVERYGTVTANEYHYFGEIGNIKLSQLGITANDFVIKNQKGEVVSGNFEWLNKDEQVDSNSTGLKEVVFIDDDNYYNLITVSHINIQGKITKGEVDAPELSETSVTYTGNDIGIYLLGLNHNFLFDVSFNGNKVTPDSNGKIATVRNVGTYTIIIELKDKVNYVWETEENSNNIVLTFEVTQNSESGGETEQKELKNLLIVYPDGREFGNDSNLVNLGSFEKNTQPDLSFSIYAQYTDNSRIKIDFEDVTISCKLNGVDISSTSNEVGVYLFTFTYQTKFIQITYTITQSSTTDPSEPSEKQIKNLLLVYDDGRELGIESNQIDFGNFEYRSSNSPDLYFNVVVVFTDGTRQTLNIEDIIIKYQFNGEEIENLPIFPENEIGTYTGTIQYKNHYLYLSYTVVKTANISYDINLDESWEYGSLNPTPTLNNYTGSDELNYNYISYEEYLNYINNFAEADLNGYSYNENIDLEPGKYVLYVDVPETDKYYAKRSNPKVFEIVKGTLILDTYGGITVSNYYYYDQIGYIKISNLNLYADNFIFKNKKGENVYGSIEWADKNELVNSNSYGERNIVFVESSNFYEVLDLGTINITGKIVKGILTVPNIDTTEKAYTGENIDIYLNNIDSFDLVTITINGEEITPEKSGRIASVKEIGSYEIVVKIKDIANYKWQTTHAQSISFTFTITPIEASYSYFTLFYDLIISKDGKIEIKLDDTKKDDNGDYLITPYVKGSVSATIINSFDINATCTVESREDGFDYLILSVESFETEGVISGSVEIHLTATGNNNYGDIDFTITNIYLTKYQIDTKIAENNYNALTNGCSVGNTISESTSKVGNVTYSFQEFETTDYGTWVLEMRKADTDFEIVDINVPLTESGDFYVRIRFIPYNTNYCTSYSKEFEITILERENTFKVENYDDWTFYKGNKCYKFTINKTTSPNKVTIRVSADSIRDVQSITCPVGTDKTSSWITTYTQNAVVNTEENYVDITITLDITDPQKTNGYLFVKFHIVGADGYQNCNVEFLTIVSK